MKKTAMLLALSCVPMAAADAGPAQCPVGSGIMQFESEKQVGKDEYQYVIAFDGHASKPGAQIEKQYSWKDAGFGIELFSIQNPDHLWMTAPVGEVLHGSDGSICLAFNHWNFSRSTIGVKSFSGIDGKPPQVCLSRDGTVSEKYMITANSNLRHWDARMFLYVGGDGGNRFYVVDSNASGCTASCEAGRSRLLIDSAKKNSARSTTEAVVSLVGRTDVPSMKLQEQYDLTKAVLEVGHNYTYLGERPPLEFPYKGIQKRDDGSVCLQFASFGAGQAGSGFDGVADSIGPQPTVCIGTAGIISAKLKMDVGNRVLAAADTSTPDVFVRLRAPRPGKTDEVLLFDADTKGCTR